MQMLVGSVFGFLLVVAIGVASADDNNSSQPALPEIELAPAVVVAAGVDSINTNAVARLTATSLLQTESGTAVQLEGERIATVTHALIDANEIALEWGPNIHVVDPATVATSQLHDLSVISGAFSSTPLAVASAAASIGDQVALGGIPEDGRTSVVTGEIIDRTDGANFGIGRPDVYVLSAPVEPGWSGGPVVNGDGEVIAIIVASEQSTGVTLAVPIEYLPAP